jgi:hypothetical protein
MKPLRGTLTCVLSPGAAAQSTQRPPTPEIDYTYLTCSILARQCRTINSPQYTLATAGKYVKPHGGNTYLALCANASFRGTDNQTRNWIDIHPI